MVHLRGGCSGLIIGVVFVVLGSLLTVLFGQKVTLACQREEPAHIVCERSGSFLGWGVLGSKTQSISGLEGAWVESNCDEDCTYRVVLMTSRGDVPLTSSFSSGLAAKEAFADQVTAFVDSRQSSADISSGPDRLAALFSLSFVGMGLLVPVLSLLRRR